MVHIIVMQTVCVQSQLQSRHVYICTINYHKVFQICKCSRTGGYAQLLCCNSRHNGSDLWHTLNMFTLLTLPQQLLCSLDILTVHISLATLHTTLVPSHSILWLILYYSHILHETSCKCSTHSVCKRFHSFSSWDSTYWQNNIYAHSSSCHMLFCSKFAYIPTPKQNSLKEHLTLIHFQCLITCCITIYNNTARNYHHLAIACCVQRHIQWKTLVVM